MNSTLSELSNMLRGTVLGDENISISQLSPIDNIADGSLIFADGEHNLQLAEQSSAAAILVNRQVTHSTKPLIQVDNPLQAFVQLIEVFYPRKKPAPGIHPTAIIGENVCIGNQVCIGPYTIIGAGTQIADHALIKGHVTIGENVQIGENSTIHPQVTIYDDCRIGANVTIHASSVIGSDGFGYTFVDGRHLKIPHAGNVIIEDEVEIGANTVIDRATLGATVIGKGTKIDNLVQIAHGVKLGKNNILCAFTGIAGSTVSGDQVIFAANVGVSDHVRIDSGVVLGARTGVPPKKHLKEGNVYLGNPARPKEKFIEQEVSLTRIPHIRKHLKTLNDKIDSLCERISQTESD